MRIETIQTFRVLLPLREPYQLSYGSIEALASVWVRVQLEDGRTGWGESTPLPGYSSSDINSVWRVTTRMARSYVGKTASSILCSPPRGLDGFLFTAVWTALEEASGAIPRLGGHVPLAGIAQEKTNESPQAAVRRMRSLGYRVFKIKVGFSSLDRDLQRLLAFQEELEDEERLRIDANQALSEQQAAVLLRCCDPGKVELFEQPLPIGAWLESSRLARSTPIPIMLDEAITDRPSLEQAARTGAGTIVKLKWMKQGGMANLQAMADRARELGLRVVLGNGVAGWIDNRHEAIFWLAHLQTSGLAGEMNGHLKISGKLPFLPLRFRDGHLSLTADPLVDISPDAYLPVAMEAYAA